jgi:hypothetical protein
MRIRSTKPEFWRSERIASVSWDARLVLKGLESYVDDNGVGKDDLALIVADVFPRDLSRNPPGTLRRVSEAITLLEQAGLVWRYEVDGTRLLYLSFWESVQRIEKPTNGRFRRPDGTLNYRESQIRESSRNPPGILRPGTGEQGNRGTGEQGIEQPSSAELTTRSKYPPAFEEFWSNYPRKVGKDKALTAWQAARKRTSDQAIRDGAARMSADPNLPEAQFIPHPTTWLTRGGWNDEPFPPRGRAPNGHQQSTSEIRAAQAMALAEEYLAEETNPFHEIEA